MAGVLRITLRGLIGGQQTRVVLPVVQQKCNISGKSRRGDRILKKPAPYPYKDSNYNFFNALFDTTTKRFDENTKVNMSSAPVTFSQQLSIILSWISTFSSQVIVVDGPIASGKTAFAKALAEELEMHYVPEGNMDKLYVNSYGFDMRTLNAELPPCGRCFDEKDFLLDPRNPLAATLQIEKYIIRFEQYVDAMTHLLSTGQGLVFDRSCYSDFVFLEAMFKSNYISRDARRVYHELKQNTIGEVLRPHLAIYLDVPVAKTMENIKKRGLAWETKTKTLDEKFLTDMETTYKQEYLKDISVHAELLVYDWTDGGDAEVVVEDIERIGEWALKPVA